jgi:hypothetical protein
VPHDQNEFADTVILMVKAAVAPILERVAAMEARIGGLPVAEKSLMDLRDRVVVMETKAGIPVDVPTVDLSPVLQRIAVTESQIDRLSGLEKAIGEMRDRLVACEQRGSDAPPAPEPVDLAPVLERMTDLQRAMDTKSIMQAAPSVDLSPMETRLAKAETQLAQVLDKVGQDVWGLRERMAVVETRASVPGPQGPKGQDGRDGQNGKDGADGVGWDDLIAVQNDDRSLTIKAARGERVKDIGTVIFPVEIYRGVYVDGRQYERGDCVTWGGSEFHCNEQTTSKPEQSKAWTLKVKRGRDGRDGKDAATSPVVSVGRPS